MLLRGVCRSNDISVRQTGKRIRAMSKCRTNAADRAMGYVIPNVALAVVRLSLS